VRDFKNLKVWQKSHALTLSVFRTVGGIGDPKFASLRDKLTDAGMSIATKVVVGNCQETDREFARFIRISLRSTVELENHLIAARDVEVISATDFKALSSQTVEVRRMLSGLLRHLDRSRLDPAAPKGRSAVTKP
jgi:four helix bundle protein